MVVFHADRTEAREERPRIVIASPVNGWTAERIVLVTGRVLGRIPNSEVSFSHNGEERYIPLLDGGVFSQRIYLGPGANYIKLEAANAAGRTVASLKLMSAVPAMDLKLICTWDTDRTYIDLHVKDPTGETVNWRHPTSKMGGVLMGHDIYGYGPQVFTLQRAPTGEYLVDVNYYAQTGGAPTMALITILLFEGTPREVRHVFPVLLTTPGQTVAVGRFRID